MTNKLYSINDKYSTTRLCYKLLDDKYLDEKGKIKEDLKFKINIPEFKIKDSKVIPKPEDKFETMLFLPEGEGRKGEGGLRTRGYFKFSYERDEDLGFRIKDTDIKVQLPNHSILQSQTSNLNPSNYPLISIITVVYNGEKYLEKAIKSVINQTYPNVEYIIIDGGSTDGTLDIIKKYENYIDYWVSEKDCGIYDAMNKGVSLAKGDWVYFLGADDILYDILHKISDKLDNNLLALYGDVYMPKKHKLYNGKFTKFKLLFNNICHQAIFYNKRVFNNKKFDLKYKLLADYAFNISIFSENNFKYIPILVAFFNDIDGSSSTNFDKEFEEDKLKIIKKYFGYKYFLPMLFRRLVVDFLIQLKLKKIFKLVKRILGILS